MPTSMQSRPLRADAGHRIPGVSQSLHGAGTADLRCANAVNANAKAFAQQAMGRPCASHSCMANNPRHLGGAIDADAGDKAARFTRAGPWASSGSARQKI